MRPKVYVINMRAEKGRRAHMSKLLKELNFTSVQFVTPLSVEAARKHDPRRDPHRLSHALTYRGILKKISESDHGAFVMEDDLMCVHSIADTRKRLTAALATQQQDPTDLLYLEYCFEHCQSLSDNKRVNYPMRAPMCAACIHFTPSGAKKFLKQPMTSLWIDKDFRRCIRNKDLTASGNLLFQQDPRFGSTLPDPLGYRSLNPTSEYPICTRLSWPGIFKATSLGEERRR